MEKVFQEKIKWKKKRKKKEASLTNPKEPHWIGLWPTARTIAEISHINSSFRQLFQFVSFLTLSESFRLFSLPSLYIYTHAYINLCVLA